MKLVIRETFKGRLLFRELHVQFCYAFKWYNQWRKSPKLHFHFHRIAPRGTVGIAVLFLTRSATVFVDGETDVQTDSCASKNNLIPRINQWLLSQSEHRKKRTMFFFFCLRPFTRAAKYLLYVLNFFPHIG